MTPMPSDTITSRTAVVSLLESLGIVAVIRLRDAAKLRAVVEALAAGGVRALEVTMTVPGAVGLLASSPRRFRMAVYSARERSQTPRRRAR
jgi:2-keto-3-deoxy-6-phosphogluconate aldolase